MVTEETGESGRQGFSLLGFSFFFGDVSRVETLRTFRGPCGCLLDFFRFPYDNMRIS